MPLYPEYNGMPSPNEVFSRKVDFSPILGIQLKRHAPTRFLWCLVQVTIVSIKFCQNILFHSNCVRESFSFLTRRSWLIRYWSWKISYWSWKISYWSWKIRYFSWLSRNWSWLATKVTFLGTAALDWGNLHLALQLHAVVATSLYNGMPINGKMKNLKFCTFQIQRHVAICAVVRYVAGIWTEAKLLRIKYLYTDVTLFCYNKILTATLTFGSPNIWF